MSSTIITIINMHVNLLSENKMVASENSCGEYLILQHQKFSEWINVFSLVCDSFSVTKY